MRHPLWDGPGRDSPNSDLLTRTTAYLGARLITPPGTITRIGSGTESDSTIDLAWKLAEAGGADWQPDAKVTFLEGALSARTLQAIAPVDLPTDNFTESPTNTKVALRCRSAPDVIALQEVSRDTRTGLPAHSSRFPYRLVFYSGRAAIYVHLRHEVGSWTQDGGEDWCAVTFEPSPSFRPGFDHRLVWGACRAAPGSPPGLKGTSRCREAGVEGLVSANAFQGVLDCGLPTGRSPVDFGPGLVRSYSIVEIEVYGRGGCLCLQRADGGGFVRLFLGD
ncbi:hypothetical protein XA68_16125 [Ophiocordyceps unilateralis]|uniref:Uncharacterized protein n=1 Tax=Ophiocordyceps unilateralis TaxID=268505 RepID=A0A2A9P6T7_OPHUN|nr:hypothetical protein XA68_16125 [Ophiocordyceps unilateralis]